MCVTSIEAKPKRADHDIVCYKVYRKENGCLIAPITGESYKIRRRMTVHGKFIRFKDAFRWKFDKKSRNRDTCYINEMGTTYKYRIEDGFIHVYKDMETGYFHAMKGYDGRVLCLCVIKKGTYYYEDEIEPTMCARKIKILKEVELN